MTSVGELIRSESEKERERGRASDLDGKRGRVQKEIGRVIRISTGFNGRKKEWERENWEEENGRMRKLGQKG